MPPAATTSAQALQNLQSFQGSMKNPADILTGQEQSLGVPQAQQQVSGLQQAIQNTTNLLNNVSPSVYGRTQDSLETDAQANREIQNESAPIQTTLGKQNTDLGNDQTNLQSLLGQAGTLAGLSAQGQTAQEGYLEDIYKNLYGQEQDQAAQAFQQQQLAEQEREANQKSSSSSGGGLDLSSLLNPSTPTSGLPQGVSLKDSTAGGGSGYNFTFGGTPVSAAKYAQESGGDIRTFLQQMGQSGDKTAAAALQDLINSKGVWTPAIQAKYPSLFWGV